MVQVMKTEKNKNGFVQCFDLQREDGGGDVQN